MLANLLLGLLLNAGAAVACVTAHTYMYNCAISGDTMSLQIWDNGVAMCGPKSTLKGAPHFASYDTVYHFNCTGSGARAEVTHNGAKVTYHSATGGYSAVLKNVQGHHAQFVCGNCGDDCEIHGLEYEYAFTDGIPNCSKYAKPRLCDYRDYCNYP